MPASRTASAIKQNAKKKSLLGVAATSASVRLHRMLLYQFARDAGKLDCFRCGGYIESLTEFSIDHKEAWMLSPNPEKTYFDLNNIAFSHLSCNAKAGAGLGSSAKTFCPQSHPYDDDNTLLEKRPNGRFARKCRVCKTTNDAAYRARNR